MHNGEIKADYVHIEKTLIGPIPSLTWESPNDSTKVFLFSIVVL